MSGHEGRSPEPRRWPVWPKGQVSGRGSQGGTAAPLRELGSGPGPALGGIQAVVVTADVLPSHRHLGALPDKRQSPLGRRQLSKP